MIITVTLNPAVDKTVELKNFKIGNINRIETVRKDAGGKGINVSKVITELGGQTEALGFLAGNSGQFITDSLDKLNINYSFTWIKGETRTNLKIIDTINDQETEVNEPGPHISKKYINALKSQLLEIASPNDLIVLTGSLPPG